MAGPGQDARRVAAFSLAVTIVAAATAHAADLTGKVIGITDGDTLTVLVDRTPVKVRLAEIDTPERGQPWGTRAKQALSDKVFGKQVELVTEGTDRYGRTLAHIYLDGRDINREMVREGHAWAYRKYLRDQSLLEDEATARKAGAGFWSIPEARSLPPWEYRAARRERRTPAAFAEPERPASGCGSKRYCREMASCEEARFYLEVCGLTRLDGDGDGVPCEAVCR